MIDSVSASEPLGLIAGNGRFPFLVAEAARRRGRRIVLIKLKEETDAGLEALVDETHEISLGQLGSCIAALRKAGAREAIMAGQVRQTDIEENDGGSEPGPLFQRFLGLVGDLH